jgi:hypothetical protein
MSGCYAKLGLDIAASSLVSAAHTASPVWVIFLLLLIAAYKAVILPVKVSFSH